MSDAPGSYTRWQNAEAEGREDDADWAFRTVFQLEMPDEVVTPEFTAETMKAVAAAAAADARRDRHARIGLITSSIVAMVAAVYFGAGWAVRFASALFIRVLDMLVAAVVGGADAFQTGAGFWGLLASLGRATSALASDPSVTFGMIAISAIAIAALVARQRLLGSDGEAFQRHASPFRSGRRFARRSSRRRSRPPQSSLRPAPRKPRQRSSRRCGPASNNATT
jgi:hypothetical protein